MSENKHTPGPWHIGTLGDDTRVYDQGGSLVAHTGRSDFLDRASMKANSHLIAAAPDLLAMAKWAESAIAPFSKEPAERSGISWLRAAIAKAEGTSIASQSLPSKGEV